MQLMENTPIDQSIVVVNKEYQAAILEGKQVIHDIERQLTLTSWAGMRKVYDVCERAAACLSKPRSQNRKGPTSMTKVYHDLSLAAQVSPASVRNAHKIFHESVQVLGSLDATERLALPPASAGKILLTNELDQKQKKALLVEAIEKGYNKWQVDARIASICPNSMHEEKVFRSTLWSAKNYDPRFGMIYPGRIPGQYVLSLLYHYTKEKDLCFFPFVGGGTEADVAKFMNRRYYAWDVQEVEAVKKEHKEFYFNANSFMPWTIEDYTEERADLIFADLPRFVYGDGRWEDNVQANPALTINGDDVDHFVEYITIAAHHAKLHLKQGGVYACMVRQPGYLDIPKADVAMIAANVIGERMELERRIVCTATQNIDLPATKPGNMAPGYSDLLIFRHV